MITESDCKKLEQLSSQLLHFFYKVNFYIFMLHQKIWMNIVISMVSASPWAMFTKVNYLEYQVSLLKDLN